MNIEVARDDLHEVRTSANDQRQLDDGEVRLAIDSFGLTSNNITYAVFGDLMQYWSFFPVPEPETSSWGRVPVWGFAHVEETTVSHLAVGTRVFGYLPMASSVVVIPGRFDDSGFTDLAPNRNDLPSVYNRYTFVTADPLYRETDEGLIMLLRPLFITSFVIDDFIGDHDLFGAETMIISSASSKTAIAAAHLLTQREGVSVIGLTSPANTEFVSSLDCYDHVITYDEVSSLPLSDALYIDVAGRRDVTRAVHEHFGARLMYSMVVGDTHWDANDTDPAELVGPRPEFLFAPVQIAKRRTDWGRDGFEENVGAAWDRFIPWTRQWMRTIDVDGAEEIIDTYRALLDGEIDPTVGHVCSFGASR